VVVVGADAGVTLGGVLMETSGIVPLFVTSDGSAVLTIVNVVVSV
jgi:hypothetical protein